MGLLDIGSRVVTTYKADVSDMKRGLKELQGEEKKLAEQQLKASQDRNDQLESWVKGLGKSAIAIGVVVGAVKVGIDAVKSYGETLRLEAAAGSANIESLQNAFDGLISRHDALAFAAVAQHGALKLTQEQMETVGRATIALTHAGFDQEEVFKKLQDAVVSLKVNGLDDLGISVQKGSSDAQTLSNVLEALRQKTDQLGPSVETHIDDVQRLSVKWADAKDKMEEYIAKAALYISSTDADKKEGFSFDVIDIVTSGQYGKLQDEYNDLYTSGIDKTVVGGYAAAPKKPDPWGDTQAQLNEVGVTRAIVSLGKLGKRYGDLAEANKRAQEAADKARAAAKSLADSTAKSATDALVAQLEAQQEQADEDKALARGSAAVQGSLHAPTDDLSGIMDKVNAAQQQADQIASGESVLSKIFGKPEEFDAYKELFDGLTSGVSSAYEAIVTGSEPAGKAFKKAIGEQMLAIGKSEAVLAIKEGAWALGDLAIGNIPGASAHALSAAEHAAAAVAAGVAAHELGAGGSSTASKGASGGGATTGGGASGGGASQQQPQQTVIVIGEAFAESTPRMRQLQAQQVLKRAGVGNSALEDS